MPPFLFISLFHDLWNGCWGFLGFSLASKSNLRCTQEPDKGGKVPSLLGPAFGFQAELELNNSHFIIRPLHKAGPQPSTAGTLREQLTSLFRYQEGTIFYLGLLTKTRPSLLFTTHLFKVYQIKGTAGKLGCEQLSNLHLGLWVVVVAKQSLVCVCVWGEHGQSDTNLQRLGLSVPLLGLI